MVERASREDRLSPGTLYSKKVGQFSSLPELWDFISSRFAEFLNTFNEKILLGIVIAVFCFVMDNIGPL